MQPVDPLVEAATEVDGARIAAGAGAPLGAGARVGAYIVRGLLGEGGMGRVYLASQIEPVRREVALKLIREQVADALARAYFDVERQALAQMQHPAIAQVFDAGTTADGHPYLAMEVVEGRALTRFCREERLPLAQRLDLFARVCRGVQHAHQKGVIHRDLKPANVLVQRIDGRPMPKIIDFGIAVGGDVGDGGRTVAASADRAGTAIYMSPEQSASTRARGLDTRSDVYSLGVMLYEVLTDADAATLSSSDRRSMQPPRATLLAAIGSDPGPGEVADAAALLQAARRLPAELRAILRKALADDRDQRYDSAAALADDLERFRKRRPVKAMPQSRLYLARTFIARHRLGLIAASLTAAALLAGIALALDGQARAERSAALARVEAAKAAQVADFVRGILAGVDPDRARSMDRSLMRLVLDSAADRAGKELEHQPAVRSEIERTIADSYSSLGETALAAQHYDAALAAARAAQLSPAHQARLMLRGAEMLDNQGKAAEAVPIATRALALVASLPEDDRDRLHIESSLAGIQSDAGHADAARTRYLRVLERQRRLFGEADEDTLTSINGLAMTDSDLARFDEARPLYETLIARRRAALGDEHSQTLNAINGLAVVELEQKHYAAAERLLAPQMPVYERVFGKEHPLTLRIVNNLGGAIRQQGRNEEARPYYERALALSHKLYGDDSPSAVIAQANLAALLRDAGEFAEAERHGRAAVEHADAAFGENPLRAIMHKELASVLIGEQHYADAERELDRAWAILSAAAGFGPSHPRSQEVVDTYLALYAAWKKPEREALWRARRTPLAQAP